MSGNSCNRMVGRSMMDMFRVAMITWCWLFVRGTIAARTRSLSLSDVNDSDMNLTTPQLIVKYGYPAETHTVINEDGYFLVLHRIPHGKNDNSSPRPAVLIHHALLCSSFDWVVMGPEKSLGFILADAGYDVWLANARGNTYSRKHASLDPADSKFWDFGWHEMGLKDVPAEIDYILATTGQEKLYYIGHSMGTTMFFVMASQRPEYNEKIRAMIAFAPVGHFSRAKGRFSRFLEFFGEGFLEKILNLFNYQEFLPQDSVLNPLSRILCKENAITQGLCINFMYFITGKSDQLYKKRLTVMLAHTPAGCSTRQVTHFAQIAVSGEFRQYDFGTDKNMELYGQEIPPKYDFSKVTAPVSVYYSDNDVLAPYYNVKVLVEDLQNVIGIHRIPFKKFNHIDFMWGKSANTLVYQNVLRILESCRSDNVTT